jgi:hypothetical protein
MTNVQKSAKFATQTQIEKLFIQQKDLEKPHPMIPKLYENIDLKEFHMILKLRPNFTRTGCKIPKITRWPF